MFEESSAKQRKLTPTIIVWEIFPLLALVVAAYAVFVIMYAAENVQGVLSSSVFSMPIVSGGRLSVTVSDLFLFGGIFLLFIEVLKATQTDSPSLMNHGFSMVVFIVCMVLLFTLERFGTSTFLLITSLTLFDVVAGFIISAIAARRDIGLGG